MYNDPIAYFLTFSTYGSRLHGDERGSVFTDNNTKTIIGHKPGLHDHKSGLMKSTEVNLEKEQREIVLNTISEHCKIKNWVLFAAHVRSNHVHLLIKANKHPDKILNELKSWSTRKLREAGHEFKKVWTRHGSTHYIFDTEKLNEKARYIINEQGEMMDFYVDKRFYGLLNPGQ